MDVGGEEVEVAGQVSASSPSTVIAHVKGATYAASVAVSPDGRDIDVFVQGQQYRYGVPHVVYSRGVGGGGGGCVAPMAGRVVKVAVEAGEEVKKGAALVVMEAMKMEHVIRAPADAVVKTVLYAVGDFVDGGKVLVQFEEEHKGGEAAKGGGSKGGEGTKNCIKQESVTVAIQYKRCENILPVHCIAA